MTIPVYVLSGFFESGKTTLLDSCLDQTEKTSTLVLQFELGIVPLRQDVNKLQFTKKMLETDVPNIVETVVAALNRLDVSELWIEWNCFTEIQVLQEILLKITLQTQHKLKIEQLVYTTEATTLKSTIQDIGGATIEQLAMSDCLVINGYETYKDKYHLKQIIKEMNSDSKIYSPERFVSNLYNILYKKKVPSSLLLLLSVLAIVVGYMIFVPIAAVLKFPINAFTNIFIGIIFQAIPLQPQRCPLPQFRSCSEYSSQGNYFQKVQDALPDTNRCIRFCQEVVFLNYLSAFSGCRSKRQASGNTYAISPRNNP